MMLEEKNIDSSDPRQFAIDTIHVFIRQLERHLETTSNPIELEWEIKVYKYMLLDPEVRLKQYNYARFGENDTAYRPKREAIKILGWNIE